MTQTIWRDGRTLELFCSGFGEDLSALASSVALLLGLSVFREHLLGAALGDDCHCIRDKGFTRIPHSKPRCCFGSRFPTTSASLFGRRI